VWTAVIIVGNPLNERVFQVSLGKWDEKRPMNRSFVIGMKAQDLIGRVRRKSLKKHPNGIFAHFRTS
jgi:hypothetical protein